MKRRLLPLFACLALANAVLVPAFGAEPEPDAKAIALVAQEVLTQQKVIAENQAKIDARLAEIAEDVRVARIFVSRGGGKK